MTIPWTSIKSHNKLCLENHPTNVEVHIYGYVGGTTKKKKQVDEVFKRESNAYKSQINHHYIHTDEQLIPQSVRVTFTSLVRQLGTLSLLEGPHLDSAWWNILCFVSSFLCYFPEYLCCLLSFSSFSLLVFVEFLFNIYIFLMTRVPLQYLSNMFSTIL